MSGRIGGLSLCGSLQFQVFTAPPKQVAELLVKHFMSPWPFVVWCPKAILNHRPVAQEAAIICVHLISHRVEEDMSKTHPVFLKALPLSAECLFCL